MKVVGTIVITDPCYMKGCYSHALMRRNTIYGDWSCMVYPGTMEENKKPEEWDEFYFKFWNDYNFGGHSDEEKKTLHEEFKKFREEWNKNILGEFCADGGEVAVYDWDELGDENKQWVKEHPWCATVIEDFVGDVDFVITKDEDNHQSVHVVGTGFKGCESFFSVQSGF